MNITGSRRWPGSLAEQHRRHAGMPAMLLGEASRWYPSDAAVGPHLVVVPPPGRNLLARLVQRLEPVLVEALVPEAPVEALDVAVLHGPSWLDQEMPHAMGLRPADEGPAGELRTVVGSDGCRVAPEDRCLVQQPGHVLTADAVVHRDVHGFVAEVVGHGQTLQAPAVGQAVADEVHAPHFVDPGGDVQRRALGRRPAHLLAPAHGQVGIAVQPVHPLVIDAREGVSSFSVQ